MNRPRTEDAPPTVRSATAEDSPALWRIRNQEDVRAVSNNHDPIPWEQHAAWFERYRANPRNHAFVLVQNGAVVGYCRIDDGLVSIALDGSVRGKGYGKRLLAESVQQYDADGVIRAFIRCGNEASLRLFRSTGFVQDQEDPDGYHLTYRGPLRP